MSEERVQVTQEPPPPHLIGNQDEIQFPKGRHKVWLATLLALLLTGAGQFYNRQYMKGVSVVVTSIGLSTLIHPIQWGIAFVLFYSLCWLIDARTIAKKLHEGQSVRKWEFF